MVNYCIAALLTLLVWIAPAAAWAVPLSPLAQAPTATVPTEAATESATPDAAPFETFSDDDITTFADAYQQVQTIRFGAEQKMAQAVQAEGLSVERFNAIAETQIDDPADSPEAIAKVAARAKISKAENKQFQAAVDRIIAIRQNAEGDMEAAIEDKGMAIDTFNRILEQSADDTDLQHRISDIIVQQTLANATPGS
jgi:hypothetical protein